MKPVLYLLISTTLIISSKAFTSETSLEARDNVPISNQNSGPPRSVRTRPSKLPSNTGSGRFGNSSPFSGVDSSSDSDSSISSPSSSFRSSGSRGSSPDSVSSGSGSSRGRRLGFSGAQSPTNSQNDENFVTTCGGNSYNQNSIDSAVRLACRESKKLSDDSLISFPKRFRTANKHLFNAVSANYLYYPISSLNSPNDFVVTTESCAYAGMMYKVKTSNRIKTPKKNDVEFINPGTNSEFNMCVKTGKKSTGSTREGGSGRRFSPRAFEG